MLAYNFTSTDDADPSCVLKVGDHPFINKLTHIPYRRGQTWPLQALVGLIADGFYVLHTKADAALVRKIQEGALQSRFAKQRHQVMVALELGLPLPGPIVIRRRRRPRIG